MATNVISAVHTLCSEATKTGHPLNGKILRPSEWATEAGFPGSKASPLRKFMARDSGSGGGRTGRYGKQDAEGMLELLAEAEAYQAAKDEKQQDAARKRVQRALTKKQAAASQGAKSSKRVAKTTPKGKVSA